MIVVNMQTALGSSSKHVATGIMVSLQTTTPTSCYVDLVLAGPEVTFTGLILVQGLPQNTS